MDWRQVKIEDIFDVARGGSPRPIHDYITDDENGINWIMIGDTKGGGKYIEKTAKKIKSSGIKKSRVVKEGDFLLTNSMSFGRPYILKTSGCIHDGWLVLSPIDENIHTDYFYHYLGSSEIKAKLSLKAAGAVVKNLNKDIVQKLQIRLPPLETQKKIATILDAADAYRQKTKALIEKYDELTQSLFLDMFGDPVTNPKGWAIKKLGDVCPVGSSKRVFVDELVEEGVPFYRGTEVGQLGEGKGTTPSLFITQEHYEKLKDQRGIPKQGDLLMPSICPDGRIWVVDTDAFFYFKDGRVLWVEVDPRSINSIYLRYHLKGSFFASYSNIASGTTFAELKIVALKKMDIFYPELDLQNQFADRVQELESQKAHAQHSLEKAEELFNSLLQRAFKGEIAS
jgi:type I restriction enzyme, S subunit